MFRKLIAPIVIRFQPTDGLLDAIDMLEYGYRSPKYEQISKKEFERVMLVIARELVRRKVIFWT